MNEWIRDEYCGLDSLPSIMRKVAQCVQLATEPYGTQEVRHMVELAHHACATPSDQTFRELCHYHCHNERYGTRGHGKIVRMDLSVCSTPAEFAAQAALRFSDAVRDAHMAPHLEEFWLKRNFEHGGGYRTAMYSLDAAEAAVYASARAQLGVEQATVESRHWRGEDDVHKAQVVEICERMQRLYGAANQEREAKS